MQECACARTTIVHARERGGLATQLMFVRNRMLSHVSSPADPSSRAPRDLHSARAIAMHAGQHTSAGPMLCVWGRRTHAVVPAVLRATMVRSHVCHVPPSATHQPRAATARPAAHTLH